MALAQLLELAHNERVDARVTAVPAQRADLRCELVVLVIELAALERREARA